MALLTFHSSIEAIIISASVLLSGNIIFIVIGVTKLSQRGFLIDVDIIIAVIVIIIVIIVIVIIIIVVVIVVVSILELNSGNLGCSFL